MFELEWGTVVHSDGSNLSHTFPCHSTSAAIYLCHSTSAPAYLCYTQPWKLAQTAWPHFTCLQELWNVILYWCNKHSIALVHIATWPHGGLKTSSYLYVEIAEPTARPVILHLSKMLAAACVVFTCIIAPGSCLGPSHWMMVISSCLVVLFIVYPAGSIVYHRWWGVVKQGCPTVIESNLCGIFRAFPSPNTAISS